MTSLLGRITAMRSRNAPAVTAEVTTAAEESDDQAADEPAAETETDAPAATDENEATAESETEAAAPAAAVDPAAVRAEAAQVIALCDGNAALAGAMIKHGIGLDAAKDIVAAVGKSGLSDAQAKAFDRLVAGQSPEIDNSHTPGQRSDRAEAAAFWDRVRAKSETGRKEG